MASHVDADCSGSHDQELLTAGLVSDVRSCQRKCREYFGVTIYENEGQNLPHHCLVDADAGRF
jgi:hypothetical protein